MRRHVFSRRKDAPNIELTRRWSEFRPPQRPSDFAPMSPTIGGFPPQRFDPGRREAMGAFAAPGASVEPAYQFRRLRPAEHPVDLCRRHRTPSI
jgi:hypothetical protein